MFVFTTETYRFAVKAGCTDCVCDVARRRHRASLNSSGLKHTNKQIYRNDLTKKIGSKHHIFFSIMWLQSYYRLNVVLL